MRREHLRLLVCDKSKSQVGNYGAFFSFFLTFTVFWNI